MGRGMEKVRQKVLFASKFTPTQNDRTTNMYAELQQYGKMVSGYEKHVKGLEKATLEMLHDIQKAYNAPLPRDYCIDTYTDVLAKSKPIDVEDPARHDMNAKLTDLKDIETTLVEKLNIRVYEPCNTWLNDLASLKRDLARLEKHRLDLDSARRAVGKSELRKVKHELNKGGASDSFKAKVDVKHTQLEGCKATYDNAEAEVYQRLIAMVSRASVMRESMVHVFDINREAMQRAQSTAPPTPAQSLGYAQSLGKFPQPQPLQPGVAYPDTTHLSAQA